MHPIVHCTYIQDVERCASSDHGYMYVGQLFLVRRAGNMGGLTEADTDERRQAGERLWAYMQYIEYTLHTLFMCMYRALCMHAVYTIYSTRTYTIYVQCACMHIGLYAYMQYIQYTVVFALRSWSDLLTGLLMQCLVSICSSGSTGSE